MIKIGVGSKTSTGGAVIEGNPGITFDGLVASSVGHEATCPACKKGGGPIVAVGPRTITLPAGPAARAGDYVACGCPAGSNRLLAEGTVSIGSDGGSIISASSADSSAAFGAKRAAGAVPAAGRRTSSTGNFADTLLRNSLAAADAPPTIFEEEEEEEECEQPVEQRITLRLGMFFDGTGNNLGNAALTAECRRQDLEEFDEDTLNRIRQLCEAHGYRDTNGDGLYDQMPSGSYGNELSNVALLYDLYEDQADTQLETTATHASIAVYLDGIGTTGGSADSAWSMGTGQGETGVVARVNESPALIMEKLRELVDSNPQLLIEKIQFDIFGFSRGAAAARHFANEVLKPDGGILADHFTEKLSVLAPLFDWAAHASINFIGLFDTVAAIADPLRGSFRVSNGHNPGINLYLPPGCARKVVHLTAADEHRYNFSLNRVHPSHEELALPGVHSNLGGGYPAIVHEKLLVVRPRRCRSAYYPLETVDRTKVERSREWRAREIESQELYARGLPGDGEFIIENIVLPATANAHPRQAKDILLALGLHRRVRGELSRVALRIMHAKALLHAVPFDVLSGQDKRFHIPADLHAIAEKIVASALAGQNPALTREESRFLHGRYIHCSANWTSSYGFMINKPRHHNQRAVYEDQAQRGYPV